MTQIIGQLGLSSGAARLGASWRGVVMDALFGRQTEPTELVDNFVAKCSDPLGKPAWILGFNKMPQF
jgi:hypothetical protein